MLMVQLSLSGKEQEKLAKVAQAEEGTHGSIGLYVSKLVSEHLLTRKVMDGAKGETEIET